MSMPAGAVPGGPDGTVVMPAIPVGNMFTDGDGDMASVSGVGPLTTPAGQNTFTATYTHANDRKYDGGQGAIFRLTVYDAHGVARTAEKKVDSAASGEISVTFNSQGGGDAQYELWCETHDWFDTTKATDTGYDDLDYV
ncbi:hypothetical protein [uncultured Methanofollis sp.]|uniref:hypothetical protein n=1 Tax=uncultured Methanofollis sp. TaxID=262500 RepID=UPI00261BC816|nr:hypothetical protein [uncultured Methanofollis sp.]